MHHPCLPPTTLTSNIPGSAGFFFRLPAPAELPLLAPELPLLAAAWTVGCEWKSNWGNACFAYRLSILLRFIMYFVTVRCLVRTRVLLFGKLKREVDLLCVHICMCAGTWVVYPVCTSLRPLGCKSSCLWVMSACESMCSCGVSMWF